MSMTPLPVEDLPRPKRRRDADAQSEHDSQVCVMQWAAVKRGEWPELDMLFAVPNGGLRSAATAGKLKAEGVKTGVPDLVFPVPRCGFHGLVIELKAGDNKPTKAQEWWLAAFAREGWCAVTCWTANQAIETLEDYLTGRAERLQPT